MRVTLTLHGVQVFQVRGGGARCTSRGGQGRQQVGGVRAAVARQQGHLVVVLCCGQAGVGRCGGNGTEEGGKERTPALLLSFVSHDNQLSTNINERISRAG